MIRIERFVIIVTWIWAIAFIAAVFWQPLFDTIIPLPGLVNFSKSKYSWVMAFTIVAFSVWLSMPKLITRDRLLIFEGVTLTLSFIGFLFISVPYGLACSSIASGIRRTIKSEAKR